MNTFYFIRHGETKANVSGILQGHMDVPLSDVGRKQAQTVADALKDVRVDAIYSSDLSRASETAKIIARHHDVPVAEVAGFREVKCGLFEGRSLDDNAKLYPDEVRALKEDPLNTRRPGGESFKEFSQRVRNTFDEIRKNHKDDTVFIVAHGGTLRCLMDVVTTLDPRSPSVANCSITVVEENQSSWNLVKYNDVLHLVEAGFLNVKEKAEMYRW